VHPMNVANLTPSEGLVQRPGAPPQFVTLLGEKETGTNDNGGESLHVAQRLFRKLARK